MKVEEKIRARQLRVMGLSIKDIAKMLRVAKSSVSFWVRDIKLTSPQRKQLEENAKLGALRGRQVQSENWKRYRLLHPKIERGPRWPKREVESFFDSWNPEVAYVLGYFSSDGCMYKNKAGSCYIGFTSVDKELIEGIKSLLKISNKIEERAPKGNHKRAYTIQIGSKRVFGRFMQLGLTPNKSLTLKLPAIPSYLLGHFLRGYFDGDGCASLRIARKTGRSNKLYQTLSLRFSSGSYSFLRELQLKLIQEVGTEGGFLSRRKDGSNELVYSRKSDVEKLYSFMYNYPRIFYLKRKYYVLSKGLEHAMGL